MNGFRPSEIPILGNVDLPWFDPEWPWNLGRVAQFAPIHSWPLSVRQDYDVLLHLDLIPKPAVEIDFSKARAVAMWAGRRDLMWEHCEPQSVLIKFENRWLVLNRHISEIEVVDFFEGDQAESNYAGRSGFPCPTYLDLGVEGNRGEYVSAHSDGETCTLVVFNPRAKPFKLEWVSDGVKNMIDKCDRCNVKCFTGDYAIKGAVEFLAGWGFVQSKHWPAITRRFPAFDECRQYLIYLNELYPDGSHPLHDAINPDDAIEALIRIQEEAESSEDPTKELYGLTYDLLNRLRQLDGLGLSIANPHVNEQDWEIGGNLPVELSWDCLAADMKIYNEAYPLFLRGQLRLRILQQIPSVHAEVWRTYANKPRAKTYIDEAHDLINRFIRMIGRILTDFDYEKERTKKGFLEEYKKLSSRWGIREYSLSDLDELESNLNWEWGCILDRRELSQPNRNSPRTAPTTTPKETRGRKTDPQKEQKKKDLSYLRSEYLKWQEEQRESTPRRKFNPHDWFADFDRWKKRARDIFDLYSSEYGESFPDAEKLEKLLDLARK